MPRFKFVVHKAKASAQNGKKHKQEQKHNRRAMAANNVGNLLDKNDDDKQTYDDDLRHDDDDERNSKNPSNSNNGSEDFRSLEQHMLLAAAALPNLSPVYFSASSRTMRTGRSSGTLGTIGRTNTNSSKYRDLLVPSFSSHDDEEQEQDVCDGGETKAKANGLGLPNDDDDRGNQGQSMISANYEHHGRLFPSFSQQSSASCYSSSFGEYDDDETVGVSTEWVTQIDYQPRTGGVKKPESTIIRTPAGVNKENKEEEEKEQRDQPEQEEAVDNHDVSAIENSNDGNISNNFDSGDDYLKSELETAHLYYDTKRTMASSKTMSTAAASYDLSSSLPNDKTAQNESPVVATAAPPARRSFLALITNTLWVCADDDNSDDNSIIKCGRGRESSDESTLGEGPPQATHTKTSGDKEMMELTPTMCMGATVDGQCDDSNDDSDDSNDDDSSDSDEYDEYTSGSTTVGDDTETNASTTLGDYSVNLTYNYTTTGDSYTRASTLEDNEDEDEDDGEDGTRGGFSASTIGDEETLATYTDVGLASTMDDASVIGDPTLFMFNDYGEEDNVNDIGNDYNGDCDDKDTEDDQRDDFNDDNCISNINDEGYSANNNVSNSSSTNNNDDNNSNYGSQKSFQSPLSDSNRTTRSNCRLGLALGESRSISMRSTSKFRMSLYDDARDPEEEKNITGGVDGNCNTAVIDDSTDSLSYTESRSRGHVLLNSFITLSDEPNNKECDHECEEKNSSDQELFEVAPIYTIKSGEEEQSKDSDSPEQQELKLPLAALEPVAAAVATPASPEIHVSSKTVKITVTQQLKMILTDVSMDEREPEHEEPKGDHDLRDDKQTEEHKAPSRTAIVPFRPRRPNTSSFGRLIYARDDDNVNGKNEKDNNKDKDDDCTQATNHEERQDPACETPIDIIPNDSVIVTESTENTSWHSGDHNYNNTNNTKPLYRSDIPILFVEPPTIPSSPTPENTYISIDECIERGNLSPMARLRNPLSYDVLSCD
uniref:Uncharacterized protein n=1 Tax=Pseudo-nitzschia australis TaxID=44445 RepID=A0A7S4AE46_9STRA